MPLHPVRFAGPRAYLGSVCCYPDSGPVPTSARWVALAACPRVGESKPRMNESSWEMLARRTFPKPTHPLAGTPSFWDAQEIRRRQSRRFGKGNAARIPSSTLPTSVVVSASRTLARRCQMPDAMKVLSSSVSRPDSCPVSRLVSHLACDPDDASEPGAADGKGAAHAASGSSGWGCDAGASFPTGCPSRCSAN